MITLVIGAITLFLAVAGFGHLEPSDDQVETDDVGRDLLIMEAIALSAF